MYQKRFAAANRRRRHLPSGCVARPGPLVGRDRTTGEGRGARRLPHAGRICHYDLEATTGQADRQSGLVFMSMNERLRQNLSEHLSEHLSEQPSEPPSTGEPLAPPVPPAEARSHRLLLLLRRHAWLLLPLLLSAVLLTRAIHQPWTGYHQTTDWPMCAWNLVRHGWGCSRGLGSMSPGAACPENPALYISQPPLALYPMAVSMALFGQQEWAARLPNILFSVGIVVLAGVLGTRLIGRRAGFLAALFAALFPMLQYYGRHTERDPMALLFVLLSVLFYLNWLDRRDRRNFGLFTGCALLAGGCVWAGHLVLPWMGVHYILFERRRGEWLPFGFRLFAIWLAGVVATFAYLTWAGGGDLGAILARWRHRTGGGGSGYVFATFYHAFYDFYHSRFTPILRTLSFAGLLWAVVRVLRGRGSRTETAILLLAAWGVSHPLLLRQDVIIHDFRMFYLIPFVAIAAAWVIEGLALRVPARARGAAWGLLTVATLVLAVPAAERQARWMFEIRWRETGRNLGGLRKAGDLVRRNPEWNRRAQQGTPILASVAKPAEYSGFVWYGDVPWKQVATLSDFQRARQDDHVPLFLADQDCAMDLSVELLRNYRTESFDTYLLAYLDEPSRLLGQPAPDRYLGVFEGGITLVHAWMSQSPLREPGWRESVGLWFQSADPKERPDPFSRTIEVNLLWHVERSPDFEGTSYIHVGGNRHGYSWTYVLYPWRLPRQHEVVRATDGEHVHEFYRFTLPPEVRPGAMDLVVGIWDSTNGRQRAARLPDGSELAKIPIGTVRLAAPDGQSPALPTVSPDAAFKRISKGWDEGEYVFRIGQPDLRAEEFESRGVNQYSPETAGGQTVRVRPGEDLESRMTGFLYGSGGQHRRNTGAPLRFVYDLDRPERLELWIGLCPLNQNPVERFEVSLYNDAWHVELRDHPLGLHTKRDGAYGFYRIPIPAALTVSGENHLVLSIPPHRPRPDRFTGWRGWVQAVFPDMDLLLGERSEPGDGMLIIDCIGLKRV